MPKRTLDGAIFRHPKYIGLKLHAQHLFLTLLGHPDSNVAGVVYASDAALAEMCAMTSREVVKAVKSLEAIGWVVRDGNWAWLPSYPEHQAHSEKTYASAARALEACYSPVILEAFRSRYSAISAHVSERTWDRIGFRESQSGIGYPGVEPRVRYPSDPDPHPIPDPDPHPIPDPDQRADPDTIADLWAEYVPTNPQPQRPLAASIREGLRAALRREPDRDWEAHFREFGNLHFLTGKTEDPFRPDILWAVGPKNCAKFDAGRFQNNPTPPKDGLSAGDLWGLADKVEQREASSGNPF